MGSLKLEIDIPDFNNEINLNITIRKDGEVISTLSSDKVIESSSTSKKEIKKSISSTGNLMNIDY